LEARLDAVDRATVLFQENLTRVPTDTDKQISHLKELHETRFQGLSTQISERDLRAEQDKRTQEAAVSAAFQAQKEAAGKSEILTTKLIDGLQAVLAQSQRTTDDKIAVINARLDRGAGGEVGARVQRDDTHMTIGTVLAVIGGMLGILSFLALVIFGVANMGRQASTVVSPAVIPLQK